jgi:hypothetical protein
MIQKQCLLVRLHVAQFSATRCDRRVTNEVLASHKAGHKAGRFIKSLLPEEAIKPIAKTVSEARDFHYENTLPWEDEGQRILPNTNFDGYMAVMRKYRQLFELQVDEFVRDYGLYVEQAKVLLNGLFNPTDYPPAGAIRSKFSWRLDVLPVPCAGDFRVALPEAELAEAKASLEEKVARAAEEARKDIYRRLSDRLVHIANTLGNKDKIFRDSLIGNLRELLDLIPRLNFSGDKEIDELRQQVLDAFRGITPDDLRNDPQTRKKAAEAADAIIAKMGAFLA